MLDMFLYNWQVREDWFRWCGSLTEEELQAKRVGGMGSILKNLVHIVEGELTWLNYLLKEPIVYAEKDSITHLEDLIRFSNFTKAITQNFFSNLADDYENRKIEITSRNGTLYSFTYGKILRHMISHEIHHIGQLSIWAREIGLKPISSDLIIREY